MNQTESTQTTLTRRTPTFSIITPPGWIPLDLEPAGDQALGAGYAATVAGESVRASVIAVVLPADERITGDHDIDVDALRSTVAGPARQIPVVDASVVKLAAGPAVRIHARPEVPTDGETVSGEVVQYFVPMPDAEHVLVVSFSTPNHRFADAFRGLFDAIAASIAWAG